MKYVFSQAAEARKCLNHSKMLVFRRLSQHQRDISITPVTLNSLNIQGEWGWGGGVSCETIFSLSLAFIKPLPDAKREPAAGQTGAVFTSSHLEVQSAPAALVCPAPCRPTIATQTGSQSHVRPEHDRARPVYASEDRMSAECKLRG